MPVILKKNEIRVSYVLTDHISLSTLPRVAMKLPENERSRLETFFRLEDKIIFAVGRLLVRQMLSDCSRETLGGWPIQLNCLGKPVILRTGDEPDLRFNITHCRGLVAVVVALGRDAGIDAEFIDGISNYDEVTALHLPTIEQRFLASLGESSRRDAFLGLWTLREACLKATGEGITGHTNLHFRLDPPGVFSHSSSEVSDIWWLWREKPTEFHTLAVAVRRDPLEELVCRQEFISLESLYS